MDYIIRNAAPDDLDSLEELEKLCFSVPWTRDQLRSALPDSTHELLVAEEDGKVLGYIGMMAVLDEGYISNVAVAPEERRRGIGRSLVRFMLLQAAKRGLQFATLEVREHNEGAIALYSGEFFRVVGRRRGYYDHPKEDALLMTYFFDEEAER